MASSPPPTSSGTPPPPTLSIYPAIRPGGSLLLAWQLRGRRVLIVGGGEVASGRLRNVLEADADVTLIAPSKGLHPEVRYRIFDEPYSRSRITYHDRTFNLPSTSLSESSGSSSTETSTESSGHVDDLEGVDLVLTAIDDVTTSGFIYELAHARRIPTNVADIPPSCDFYFGSQIRDGPLQILISTNGKGPKLANLIRQRINITVDEMTPGAVGIGQVIENVGHLRERLRSRAPGVGGAVGRKRMKWMIDVCEKWSFEELALLDDVSMDRLLDEGWDKNAVVPSFWLVGGTRNVVRSTRTRFAGWATFDHLLHLSIGLSVGVIVGWTFARGRSLSI